MSDKKEKRDVKVLAVVGMSGSGKSVVVNYLTEQGYPKVYFGGMIYKEMERRGIARTEDGESEKKFREEIRNPVFTQDEIRCVIFNYRKIDATKLEGRKKLVDSFVNSIYLYDDYFVITFNYKNHSKKVSFDEIKNSCLTSLGSPAKRIGKTPILFATCFRRANPLGSREEFCLQNDDAFRGFPFKGIGISRKKARFKEKKELRMLNRFIDKNQLTKPLFKSIISMKSITNHTIGVKYGKN